MNHLKRIVLALCAATAAAMAIAIGPAEDKREEARPEPEPMSNARLDGLIKRIDPEARGETGLWELTYEGYVATVITDERADRARIVVRVADAAKLTSEAMHRILQANFDSVLDARYAIARGAVWATFIHPLSSMNDREFFSGLGQTITAAATYGTTFTSGALRFQGGDSGPALEDFYRAIMEKGLNI